MASAGLRNKLECSICLNFYTDPVNLRCGHSFCRACINKVLNTQDGSGVYSCPRCRAEFQERPELKRNIDLRDIVDTYLSMQPKPKETSYCIHSPVLAVKSCLHCEASLCDHHLRVHSKGPQHALTEPSTDLEKRKCPVHKKILENYCTEDSACICVSCSLAGEHWGHRVEMLDEASEKKKKKKKLKDVLQKLIPKREETDERVQSLEERRRKGGTGRHDVDVDEITGMLHAGLSDITCLHTISPKKTEGMRPQPPSARSLPSHTQILPVSGTKYGGDDVRVRTGGVGGKVMAAGQGGIYGQGPADLLLDVNTAANNIRISDDRKTATWTDITENRPKTAERFEEHQVISSNRFTSGRHYWDVEIGKIWTWSVGVCYPSIDRRIKLSYIGCNNKSWGLFGGSCNSNKCVVMHGGKAMELPQQISSDRVRIVVDYEAGQLSFYELCDPIKHLHTFTEPLHAVLFVDDGCIKILGDQPSHTQNLPVSGTEYWGDDVIARTEGVVVNVMAAGKGGIYGQGPADILLDVNTAANNIRVSDDRKTVTWTKVTLNRPETAERFQEYQVISSSRFTSGRHYWDVEIGKLLLWMVGMCYPSIARRGHQSFIGNSNKSWSLCTETMRNNQSLARHDNKAIQLSHQISSNRVRIYVDYEAGQLSFYELCDPIRHLHTFAATFTEPLHAILYVLGGSIKISGQRL